MLGLSQPVSALHGIADLAALDRDMLANVSVLLAVLIGTAGGTVLSAPALPGSGKPEAVQVKTVSVTIHKDHLHFGRLDDPVVSVPDLAEKVQAIRDQEETGRVRVVVQAEPTTTAAALRPVLQALSGMDTLLDIVEHGTTQSCSLTRGGP